MLINEQALSDLYTGFKGSFTKGFEGAQTHWEKIAMKVPSTTREETYGWMGQLPRLREWIGDRQVKELSAHGFKILNRDFEETIKVKRNDIEDDQFGIFGPLFSEMGRAAAELPDELTFGLLRTGFTGLGYDGKPFFSDAHVVGADTGKATAASNFQDGAGVPWFLLDTSKAIKPLIFQERSPFKNLVALDDPSAPNVFWKKEYVYGVDGRGNAGYGLWQLAHASRATLNAANYASARVAMQDLRGDEGRRLNIRPTLLVVPPDLEEPALTLINSDELPGGGSNPWRGTVEVVVTAWASE